MYLFYLAEKLGNNTHLFLILNNVSDRIILNNMFVRMPEPEIRQTISFANRNILKLIQKMTQI